MHMRILLWSLVQQFGKLFNHFLQLLCVPLGVPVSPGQSLVSLPALWTRGQPGKTAVTDEVLLLTSEDGSLGCLQAQRAFQRRLLFLNGLGQKGDHFVVSSTKLSNVKLGEQVSDNNLKCFNFIYTMNGEMKRCNMQHVNRKVLLLTYDQMSVVCSHLESYVLLPHLTELITQLLYLGHIWPHLVTVWLVYVWLVLQLQHKMSMLFQRNYSNLLTEGRHHEHAAQLAVHQLGLDPKSNIP